MKEESPRSLLICLGPFREMRPESRAESCPSSYTCICHQSFNPKKKKCKKPKWLSEEALQIAVKRREAKERGKGKIYPFECKFQRIARRDSKAFLNDQCKETEENTRMRKTRDLFKHIRDTKGTFHAKMGSIKDRNGMDLTEAEDIKKRWQEYTEELYKKDLHNPDNYSPKVRQPGM